MFENKFAWIYMNIFVGVFDRFNPIVLYVYLSLMRLSFHRNKLPNGRIKKKVEQ